MLQRKLASYATFIGKFGLAAALLVMGIEGARFRCGGVRWWVVGPPPTFLLQHLPEHTPEEHEAAAHS